MKRKIVSELMLTLLVISMLTLAFNIQQVRASGTIYIRADGSVEGTTDISTVDNITYTFTANIYDSIVVKRDNIVVDGASYTLQGTGSGAGIDLTGRSNVTIKNVDIAVFYYGIHLRSSSHNTISGNTVTNNAEGICLLSSRLNTVSGNNVTANNWCGISLEGSSNNTVYGNHITNNFYGIYLGSSLNNKFFHNNFVENIQDVYDISWEWPWPPSINSWDAGYPSGGNYWSNYTGVDADDDGIGDTPHVIDTNNQDNYPLMNPWSPKPPSPVEATQELIETIETWNLPKGIENSLTSKLDNAIHQLNKGNENVAINKLTALTNQVEALRDKKLTPKQADYLIAEAQRIIDLING